MILIINSYFKVKGHYIGFLILLNKNSNNEIIKHHQIIQRYSRDKKNENYR